MSPSGNTLLLIIHLAPIMFPGFKCVFSMTVFCPMLPADGMMDCIRTIEERIEAFPSFTSDNMLFVNFNSFLGKKNIQN